MDDARVVGSLHRQGERDAKGGSVAGWNRRAVEPVREAAAFDIFQGKIWPAIGLADFMDRDDMRVIQDRGRAGLSSEPSHPLGIALKGTGQQLQRDAATEPQVNGEVHLPHAAATEQAHDLEMREHTASRELPGSGGIADGSRNHGRSGAWIGSEQ